MFLNCRMVRRSKQREDPCVAREDGSRMVVTNFHGDQQGCLQVTHNFKGMVDEKRKFELMSEHDHILDGVVLVKSLFSFLKANIRLPRPSFPGCGNFGRSRVLSTTPFQVVCSCFESQLTQSVKVLETSFCLDSLAPTMSSWSTKMRTIADQLLGYDLRTRLRMLSMHTIWCNRR